MDKGPPMYIIAPYDRAEVDDDEFNDEDTSKPPKESSWHPSVPSPEWVVVTRVKVLAKRSYEFMKNCLTSFDETDWSAVFHETPTAFKSYSILFRVSSEFVMDADSSSTGGDLGISTNSEDVMESSYTRSMKARFLGPKALRRKLYRNLRAGSEDAVLSTWHPVHSVVRALRHHFGSRALFFFNELSPEVIGLVWRPQTFSHAPFSVMTSDYARPTEKSGWKSDSLVMRNATDFLREMSQYFHDIVTTVKIFDESCMSHRSKRRKISENTGHPVEQDEISEDEDW
jgi:hypothetical protein